jgi:hypothetical protein
MPIRIATYDGSLRDPEVAIVTAFSLFNPGVHTEIWFDQYRVMAGEGDGPKCMHMMQAGSEIHREMWHVVDIPITDHAQAFEFIREAMASPAVYGYSITELAMPKCILDTIDTDLDCCHPETWDRLFCSQFALLFLRRCAVAGILSVTRAKQRLLWSVNSKGCLPSRLQIITDKMFGGGAK